MLRSHVEWKEDTVPVAAGVGAKRAPQIIIEIRDATSDSDILNNFAACSGDRLVSRWVDGETRALKMDREIGIFSSSLSGLARCCRRAVMS